MATVDPWALLREAKRLIAANRLMLGHYSGVREVGSLEDRIDAALAAHRDEVPAQDSAKDVVESDEVEWADLDRFYIAHIGPFVAEIFSNRNGNGWVWAIAQRDDAPTVEEAKSAAIAAARELR